MQLTACFTALAFAVLSTSLNRVLASPAPIILPRADPDSGDAPYIMSPQQMAHWIATTDAELTFVGPRLNPLSPDAAQTTTVTYCSHRAANVCGGPCTVYTGSGVCLHAPNTACLGATTNVGFCANGSCGGGCNQLSSCGTRLDNGFCYTPGTNSIIVPP